MRMNCGQLGSVFWKSESSAAAQNMNDQDAISQGAVAAPQAAAGQPQRTSVRVTSPRTDQDALNTLA